MTQRAKGHAAKTEGLSSIPDPLEGAESCKLISGSHLHALSQVCVCMCVCMCVCVCARTHTCTQKNKNVIKMFQN